MIGGSRFRKFNSLYNPINHHPDFDKIYLYANYPYETRCQMSISK